MKTYTFVGAVYVWGNLFSRIWAASTTAVSASKAASNLKFRFRKANNFQANVPVTLSGDMREAS